MAQPSKRPAADEDLNAWAARVRLSVEAKAALADAKWTSERLSILAAPQRTAAEFLSRLGISPAFASEVTDCFFPPQANANPHPLGVAPAAAGGAVPLALSEVSGTNLGRIAESEHLGFVEVNLPPPSPRHGFTAFKWEDERSEVQHEERYMAWFRQNLHLPRGVRLASVRPHTHLFSVPTANYLLRGTSDVVIYLGDVHSNHPAAAAPPMLEVLRKQALVYIDVGNPLPAKQEARKKKNRTVKKGKQEEQEPAAAGVVTRKRMQAYLEALCAFKSGAFSAVVVVTDLKEDWALFWASPTATGLEISVARCTAAQALEAIELACKHRVEEQAEEGKADIGKPRRRGQSVDNEEHPVVKRFKQPPVVKKSDLAELDDLDDLMTPEDRNDARFHSAMSRLTWLSMYT